MPKTLQENYIVFPIGKIIFLKEIFERQISHMTGEMH